MGGIGGGRSLRGGVRRRPRSAGGGRTAALRRLRKLYGALHSVSTIPITGITLQKLFNDVIARIVKCGVFRIDRAGLSLVDHVTGSSVTKFLMGTTQPVFGEGAVIPLQGSAIGRAVSEGKAVIVGSIRKKTFYEDAPLKKAGVCSYVVMPILSGGRAIATLNLASNRPNVFSEDDRDFFEHLSDQLSTLAGSIQELETMKTRYEATIRENLYLKEELVRDQSYYEMIGSNEKFIESIELARRAALTSEPVLICGENGTGREAIARLIHRLSERRGMAFVKVDCKLIAPTLIRFELFGGAGLSVPAQSGQQTGSGLKGESLYSRGKVELAAGSTLFINSIESVPRDLHTMLADAVLRRQARVIAAAAIEPDMLKNIMAEELFAHLSRNVIKLPALRDRRDDIGELVRYFITKYNKIYSRNITGVTGEVMEYFMTYTWPGNINELESIIERAVISTRGNEIGADSIQIGAPDAGSATPVLSYRDIRERSRQLERELFRAALAKCGGRIYGDGGCAKLLGTSPTTLQSRLKSLGLI